uniref:Probable methyltransferase-like protein 15 homolog n=1 Tax=Cacopsylla melanoneura TaxID=428564 RepID=A0A8D8XZY1_9HEMI
MRSSKINKTYFSQNILRYNYAFNIQSNHFHNITSVKIPKKCIGGSYSIKCNLLTPHPIFKSHVNQFAQVANSNVLKNNIVNFLCTRDHKDEMTIIDFTFGDGNSTKDILENLEKVKVICLDRDAEAFEKAKELSEKDSRVIPVHGKFSDLPNVLKSMNYTFNSIDGILIDVGISNTQMGSKRGFTPEVNSILDMRLDSTGITGYQVLSAIDEVSLARVLKTYGEEKRAKKIARAIIETRYTFKKLEKTADLNDLVAAVVGTYVRVDAHRNTREHVAQKVYNGLRRFVNNELNELNYAMVIAEKYLKPHGIVVTQCHSIVEDKIVKRHLTGNVIENCANDLALKFINHNLTVDSEEMKDLTCSPWSMLEKSIATDSHVKLRVAMKNCDIFKTHPDTQYTFWT